MTKLAERSYRVNELTPDPSVVFDQKIGEQYLRYARMLAARGLVYSSTGNLVMRVPHPAYPEGVCYVKCMGVSLEEMSMDDLVITDIPFGRINVLVGEVKRNILAEQLAALRGTRPDYLSREEVEKMFKHGDAVMYPSPVK